MRCSSNWLETNQQQRDPLTVIRQHTGMMESLVGKDTKEISGGRDTQNKSRGKDT